MVRIFPQVESIVWAVSTVSNEPNGPSSVYSSSLIQSQSTMKYNVRAKYRALQLPCNNEYQTSDNPRYGRSNVEFD